MSANSSVHWFSTANCEEASPDQPSEKRTQSALLSIGPDIEYWNIDWKKAFRHRCQDGVCSRSAPFSRQDGSNVLGNLTHRIAFEFVAEIGFANKALPQI